MSIFVEGSSFLSNHQFVKSAFHQATVCDFTSTAGFRHDRHFFFQPREHSGCFPEILDVILAGISR